MVEAAEKTRLCHFYQQQNFWLNIGKTCGGKWLHNIYVKKLVANNIQILNNEDTKREKENESKYMLPYKTSYHQSVTSQQKHWASSAKRQKK